MKQPISRIVLFTFLYLGSSVASAEVVLNQGGVSGQWFNPNRSGEGLFVDIVRTSGNQRIVVAWFTYDASGFQMWLTGSAELSQDATSATVPVIVTNGPKFGPDYNPEDLQQATWGTITVNFQNCSSGLMSYASSAGMGTGAIELTRLTNLEQVQCDDPPPPTGTGITPGRWTGEGVCFYVSADGRTITSQNSICDGGLAFDSDINSRDQNNALCDAEVECSGTFAIIDNGFTCTNKDGAEIAVGSFVNGNMAAGAAQEIEGNSICHAQWQATPDNP